MKRYLLLPEQFNNLTGKTKQEKIMIYLLLDYKKDYNLNECRYDQQKIANDLNLSLSTVNRLIVELRKTPDIFLNTRNEFTPGHEHSHKVYKFRRFKKGITKNYTMVYPEILADQNLSTRLKGDLMLLKIHCQKGTNYIPHFGTQENLAKLIGIGKNQIGKVLKELERKGYIRFIDDSLIITSDYFPLVSDPEDPKHIPYITIYNYCLEQNILPPYKGNSRAKLLLYEAAINSYYWCKNHNKPFNFRKLLETRCKELPPDVSFEYFLKALFNIDPQDAKDIRKDKVCNTWLVL